MRISLFRLRHALVILALFLLAGCPKIAKAQTPDVLAPVARQQFFAANGSPLANGCLFTYNTGTSTPAPTYTDSSGLYVASNPIILDGGGFASIWIGSQSYRFILFSAGGVNCATGSQQWLVDGVSPPPFLPGNNAFTGNNTFAGTSIFNGAVTISAGGTLTGNFAGSPNFTGTPTFGGTPIFSNPQPFPAGISTDIIDGITVGSSLEINAANAEIVEINGGSGGTGTVAGGNVRLQSGGGGTTGGQGGTIQLAAGSPASGNFAGGLIQLTTGNGFGTGTGGDYTFNGGNGGTTAARGGNYTVTGGTGGASGAGGSITLTPGPGGAGGTRGNLLLSYGHTEYTGEVNPSSCVGTGFGTGYTCSFDGASSDDEGLVSVTTSGSPSTSGTLIINFSQTMGANGAICMWTLSQASTAWPTTSAVMSAGPASTNATVNWYTNGSALTTAVTYDFTYSCRGRQ